MPKAEQRLAKATSDAPAPRIFVVDDDHLLRDTICATLEDGGWIAEGFASGEAFLEAYRPGRGACLLIDAYLPGMSGLDLLRHIQDADHRLPAIIITGHSDVKIAVEAMKAGALDFLEKPVGSKDLLGCIDRAVEKANAASKNDDWREAAVGHVTGLTARQRQILDLILDGHPNKNIAEKLGISRRTVEAHRAEIMKKTGSKSVPALARLAFVAGQSSEGAQHAAQSPQVEAILATPDLADALESEQFKRFFDQIPLAIIVAEMKPPERIVYANPAFTQLTGQALADIEGQPWSVLYGRHVEGNGERTLGEAILESTDFAGTVRIERAGTEAITADVYSNVIQDDRGIPTFRLAVLVDVGEHDAAQRLEFEQRMQDKDALLLEFQHRVKNNLQMITTLIRIEAKNARGKLETVPFDRLAGRIKSIQLLYKLLSESGKGDTIDLGVYLSEIASSVMHAHATEGVRLNLKIDACPVSINVAMPTGLVVNELLTNALKHAFVGREGGTVTLHSISDSTGCRVVVADDGVGLPAGVAWPQDGKLSALIVRSLRQNADADLTVESSEKGTRVTIAFSSLDAAGVPGPERTLGIV